MKKRIFKVVPVDADILGLAVDFRFRGHRREVVEDEAVETLQTRLDPLGRADSGSMKTNSSPTITIVGVNCKSGESIF